METATLFRRHTMPRGVATALAGIRMGVLTCAAPHCQRPAVTARQDGDRTRVFCGVHGADDRLNRNVKRQRDVADTLRQRQRRG